MTNHGGKIDKSTRLDRMVGASKGMIRMEEAIKEFRPDLYKLLRGRERMEKIVGDWHTDVKMSMDEAKNICKLGQGAECCAFLICGADGCGCIRMSYPANGSIFSRLKDGTMKAKGEGRWKGCAWEEGRVNDE